MHNSPESMPEDEALLDAKSKARIRRGWRIMFLVWGAVIVLLIFLLEAFGLDPEDGSFGTLALWVVGSLVVGFMFIGALQLGRFFRKQGIYAPEITEGEYESVRRHEDWLDFDIIERERRLAAMTEEQRQQVRDDEKVYWRLKGHLGHYATSKAGKRVTKRKGA